MKEDEEYRIVGMIFFIVIISFLITSMGTYENTTPIMGYHLLIDKTTLGIFGFIGAYVASSAIGWMITRIPLLKLQSSDVTLLSYSVITAMNLGWIVSLIFLYCDSQLFEKLDFEFNWTFQPWLLGIIAILSVILFYARKKGPQREGVGSSQT